MPMNPASFPATKPSKMNPVCATDPYASSLFTFVCRIAAILPHSSDTIATLPHTWIHFCWANRNKKETNLSSSAKPAVFAAAHKYASTGVGAYSETPGANQSEERRVGKECR